MASEPHPEPDERGPVLHVGQDVADPQPVQDGGRRLEGRSVSRRAALRVAQAEGDIRHARIDPCLAPMVPLVPFGPVAADEAIVLRAA